MDSDAGEGRPKLFKWLTVLVVVLFGVAITFIVAWVILQWSIAEAVYSTKASLDWFGITFYRNYTFVAAGLFALLFVYPKPGRSDLWRLVTVLFKRVRPYEAEQEGLKLSEKLNVWVWALWQTLKWAIAFYAFSVSGGFPFLGPIMNPIMMMTMGLGSWSDVPRVFALPLNPASGAGIVGLMPTMSIQSRPSSLYSLPGCSSACWPTFPREGVTSGSETSSPWSRPSSSRLFSALPTG
jgi:hypothetical protein